MRASLVLVAYEVEEADPAAGASRLGCHAMSISALTSAVPSVAWLFAPNRRNGQSTPVLYASAMVRCR